MSKKITWDVVYRDFKLKHPKLTKRVLRFEPYDFATVKLIFANGVRMTYNYDTKQVNVLVTIVNN